MEGDFNMDELSEEASGKIESEISSKSDLEFNNVRQIWRNALVLVTTFLFLFTAFQALQQLQSSLFVEDGMGTTILAILYTCFILSALFLPVPMVAILGCKWTLVVSTASYIGYMLAHFYVSWALFIPAAAILGIGGAPLWVVKGHYLNIIAHDYAEIKGVTKEAAASLFFGIFFLFFQSTSVWGHVISTQVLIPANVTFSITPLLPDELAQCGKNFCPQEVNFNNTNLLVPPKDKLYKLAGIYTGCTCMAVIIAVFLQQLPSESGRKLSSRCKQACQSKKLIATFRQMTDYRQLLLIPLTVFVGLEQSFFISDYLQAYVTCPLGRWWVGYVSICYGVADAIGSVLFGKLTGHTGRVPIFIFGAVGSLGVIISLLYMEIRQEKLYIYFLFSGVWGLADSVWSSQFSAFYGVLFKRNSEAAFANYRSWQSLGAIIYFSTQSKFCLPTKAYILLFALTTGFIGYGVVELMEWKKRVRDTIQNENKSFECKD